MLVLTRKKGQSVMIGHDIEVSLIDIQGDQVRLGIRAPKSIAVHRKEIYEEIIRENQLATISSAAGIELLKIRRRENGTEDVDRKSQE
ncbi:MAG: carbon storage regulator CsrA [Clostridiaceae bacterium]|nr:carbon storage regulator CsrA [Clostridiaceae bacterium]